VRVTAIIIIVDQIVWERRVEEAVDIKVVGDDAIVSFVVFAAFHQSVSQPGIVWRVQGTAYIGGGRSLRVSGAR
jgi:hypothetical protein